MDSFATFDDVQARYPAVSADDEMRVTTLLSDATAMIAGEFARVGMEIDKTDELLAANLRAVCCSVVVRAMPANSADGYQPYTQRQETVGPFMTSVTLANPNGELYLTRGERRKLGLSGGIRQFFVGAEILGGA